MTTASSRWIISWSFFIKSCIYAFCRWGYVRNMYVVWGQSSLVRFELCWAEGISLTFYEDLEFRSYYSWNDESYNLNLIILRHVSLSSIYTHFNTLKKKASRKHCGKRSNFTFYLNVFFAIYILKSFHSYISVVVCSFFEFGAVSKWCVREWVNWISLFV